MRNVKRLLGIAGVAAVLAVVPGVAVYASDDAPEAELFAASADSVEIVGSQADPDVTNEVVDKGSELVPANSSTSYAVSDDGRIVSDVDCEKTDS